MMARRQFLILTLALCLCFALNGCWARRRLITRSGKSTPVTLQTATEADLEKRIAEQYEAVRNFSATVDMVPALGSAEKNKITEYKEVRAYILFRKPADIRLIGLYPVVRNKAFDMVSNGTAFRLFLPSKNLFITGNNQTTTNSPNKIENLRPQHFLEALLVHPLEPGEKPALLNLTDEDNAAYILALIRTAPNGDLHITRSVWFDRTTLSMVRLLIFDDAGNILTDAHYQQWKTYDGVPFPKQIVINRPRDEYSVVITVVKMDINTGVRDDQFALEQPEGSKLKVIGENGSTPSSEPPPPKPPSRKRKSDL
jgi:outer membrane lipoprotein-sorting protein